MVKQFSTARVTKRGSQSYMEKRRDRREIEVTRRRSDSEVAQSCPTLSNPMDCSPPGSSIHGIFQARVLEWDAIAFSAMRLDQAIIHCAGNSLVERTISFTVIR